MSNLYSIYNLNPPLPCHLTYLQVPGIRMLTSCRGHHSAYHTWFILRLPIIGGPCQSFCIYVEYSQAGHMCHERLTDVINSSIHTEQGGCPRGKADLTAGLAGLIVQPGCGMLLCGTLQSCHSIADLLSEVDCK